MFWRWKAKRHYALMLKADNRNELQLLYQVFDENGYACGAFEVNKFEEMQKKFSRLTPLFTGAYLISQYEFDHILNPVKEE